MLRSRQRDLTGVGEQIDSLLAGHFLARLAGASRTTKIQPLSRLDGVDLLRAIQEGWEDGADTHKRGDVKDKAKDT